MELMKREREKRQDRAEKSNKFVQKSTEKKVRNAVKRMKSGKVVGPDGIPIEA